MNRTTEIETFGDVIAQWPSQGTLAEDVGVKATLPAAWKHRGRIPPEYWGQIVAAASKRGYPVTLDLLASISAAGRKAA